MGLQIKFQQEVIEFQTILALRIPIYGEEREASELIPPQPTTGETYEFSKAGYRVYLLNTLPLVATEGNGKFIKVVGMAEILQVSLYAIGDAIETRGLYTIHRLFDQSESEEWLVTLRDRGSPQISIA